MVHIMNQVNVFLTPAELQRIMRFSSKSKKPDVESKVIKSNYFSLEKVDMFTFPGRRYSGFFQDFDFFQLNFSVSDLSADLFFIQRCRKI